MHDAIKTIKEIIDIAYGDEEGRKHGKGSDELMIWGDFNLRTFSKIEDLYMSLGLDPTDEYKELQRYIHLWGEGGLGSHISSQRP
jgi:hypothetical protein